MCVVFWTYCVGGGQGQQEDEETEDGEEEVCCAWPVFCTNQSTHLYIFHNGLSREGKWKWRDLPWQLWGGQAGDGNRRKIGEDQRKQGLTVHVSCRAGAGEGEGEGEGTWARVAGWLAERMSR